MIQIFENDKLAPDYWGNQYIWVPFGKQGVVSGETADYEVSLADILNTESISTLAGIPVFYQHPEETVVTPFSEKVSEPVGHCMGYWRMSKDGLGGEVLVKLTDLALYRRILDDDIVEASPTYVVVDGLRIYNHLALLKEGYARGGGKMRIRVEGEPETKETEVANSELAGQVSIVAEGYFENSRLADMDTDPVSQSIIRAQDIEMYTDILKEMKDLEKDKAADTVLDSPVQFDPTALMESFASLKVMVEGIVESLKPAPDPEPSVEEAEVAIYSEGFKAGLAAGEIIVFAESVGFERGSAAEEEMVTLAQKHVVSKAFPALKMESVESTLAGAYAAAVSLLKSTATESTEVDMTKSPTSETFRVEGRKDTPTINVNRTGGPRTAGRLKLK